MTDWDIEKSRELYNVGSWSGGYFDINDAGHLEAYPSRDRSRPGIDLYELAHEVRAKGLSFPVLARFVNILHDRVDTLCDAFAAAMDADGYGGGFTAVYPIKVNQQRSVVTELLRHGGGRVGLEAGSKPELMAVVALSNPDGLIICNGYKDREYVRLALIGKQLGLQTFIVVEKLSELDYVIDEARRMGVTPLLGVRVRLASIGAGKWQNTGGEKSKFGLSASQVLTMVERLRHEGMLDSLRLLHCHLGSQIPNIRDIQQGLRECARYFAELRGMGVPLENVDVGGGLGVDYEGSRSRSFCSMNYTVQEYAKNVVHAFWEICQQQELPYPRIITESGRAMTAHHAALITNVVDFERVREVETLDQPADEEPFVLHDLWSAWESLGNGEGRAPIEIYHNAVNGFSEAQSMYIHGVLSLEQRARAEKFYHAICQRVRRLLQPDMRSHRAVLDELNEKLADKYFVNFSLFQSLPDVWAIDQIFPIVPLHRLDERPDRRAVLEDMTCDSDGRIDNYVDRDGVEPNLPVHRLDAGDEPYLLGIFLVGAYQEILGDMHNLFGDTDSVNVEICDQGAYRLSSPQRGDTVDSVLRYVRFDPEELLLAFREKTTKAALAADVSKAYLTELEAGLKGYTYLED